MKILIENATLFTGGENGRVLSKRNILIENSKISKISSKKIQVKDAKRINADGRVVMPSFVNAHMHFYSTFARGLYKIKPSKNFVEVLENLWWRLDKKLTLDSVYYSTMVVLLEAIKKGTTTFIDHHASPYAISGSLSMIEKALRDTGLRGILCYEVSDRDGRKKAEEGLKENYDFIVHTQKKNDNFIKAMFGLHASFTLSNETLEIASDLGNSLNAGFHIHCAEAESDEKHCIKNYGMRVVERLNKFLILGENTILAHCVHINDREIEIISRTRTNVVINPQSNLNNAVGIADSVGFINKQIMCGLGTDAMTVNMLEELRVALWVSHIKNNNPSTGFNELVKIFSNNYKIASKFFKNTGEIKEGNYADIIITDYIPSTPLNDNNFYGHLIFGISQSAVDTTIVNGRILMENKKLKVNVDEKEIYSKSKELAEKLWRKF